MRKSFPRFLERPRLFVWFEYDLVFWFLGGTGITFGILFFTTLNSFFIFVIPIIVGLFLANTYSNIKENVAPSFSAHLLYSMGVNKLVSNKTQLLDKSLNALDVPVDRVIPDGDVRSFVG